jgi:hypothetical protein
MGWCGGSSLMEILIDSLKKNVKDAKKRIAIYEDMIRAFMDEDWDTVDECIGMDPAFDAALKRVDGAYFETED